MSKKPDPAVVAVLMVYRALQSRPGRLISHAELIAEGANLEISAESLNCGVKKGLAAEYLASGGDGLIELKRAGFAAMMRIPRAGPP